MKRKLWQKLSVITLSAIMLFGCTPIAMPVVIDSNIQVQAADDERDFYTTENSDGTVTIGEYFGNKDTITIPSIINGKSVKAIGAYSFAFNNTLKNVVIPNSITAIENRAFECCDNLSSVRIPETVTSFGPSVFAYSNYNLKLYVKRGSQAEKYAKENELHYVYYSEVDSIRLNKSSTTIFLGKSETLTYSMQPQSTFNEQVTWSSSNKQIASVSNGKITAKSVGTATITAKSDNGKTASCTVTVTATVSGISLNKSATVLGIGESDSLKATLLPEGVTDHNLTWTSSNKNIVSVSNGKITAQKIGTASITVKTSNGKTATCSVTVKNAPSKVTVTKDMVTLGVGEKYTLGSGINDSAGCATRIFSTSNANIVRLTRTTWQGELVAVKPGIAYITVKTYNGKTATCKVTVKNAPSKVSITKGIVTLGVGESYSISSSIPDGTGAAKRTFRTSDTSVIQMTKTDWTGNFKALKPGVAYVTVRLYNGKEASCKVTVKAVPSKVSLNKGVLSLGVGETYQLNAVLPANTGAAKRIFRTSNSSVIKMTKIDWEGQFTAVKPGIAYVTVRLYNGKEASCKITVKAAPNKVSLNKTTITLGVGETAQLSAIIPSNSAAATRTFYSGNSSIVRMTSTNWIGKFTAIKIGTTYVSVKLYNGKTASCKVIVKERAGSYSFGFDQNERNILLKVGETRKFNISFNNDTYSNNVIFQAENNCLKIIAQDETSVTVKAVKPGSTSVYTKLRDNDYDIPVTFQDYDNTDPQRCHIFIPDPSNNNQPIIFETLKSDAPNSVGGVDVIIRYYNNSNKKIKYAYFTVQAYNAVDDPVQCTIRDTSVRNLYYTGPILPKVGVTGYWSNVWYNYSIRYCKWITGKCSVEYMDGTSVKF